MAQMPDDVCYCESNGCGRAGGIKYDRRTVMKHMRTDRYNSSVAARLRDRLILDAEQERLGCFISGSTL